MKAFSEEEKTQIKKSLMDNCLYCWGAYGFTRTNVSELCQMVGISVGAFYKLYNSKEHLFYEASQEYERSVFNELEAQLQKEPNKYGLIKGVKAMIKAALNSVWFYQINNDLPKIVRKLNLDIKKESQNIIAELYEPLFRKYHIRFKKPLEEVIVIIVLLYGGVLFKEVVPVDITSAMDFIIESTILQLVAEDRL